MSTAVVNPTKGEMEYVVESASANRLARIAGLLYLVIIGAGIFGEFIVRQSLIVRGDAAATAENILAAERLFRAGIAADLLMITADIALAVVFYYLFRAVSRSLSALAAVFRLAQASILAVNLLNLIVALQLVVGPAFLATVGAEQRQALGLVFLDAHGIGYSIGLVFFGVNLFILAYLVLKSAYVPRVIGILLAAAALGYLADAFAKVLLPNYGDYQAIFDTAVFLPAFVAELAFCLWLLIKGVRLEETETSGG